MIQGEMDCGSVMSAMMIRTNKAALAETYNSPDLKSQQLARTQALMNHFKFR